MRHEKHERHEQIAHSHTMCRTLVDTAKARGWKKKIQEEQAREACIPIKDNASAIIWATVYTICQVVVKRVKNYGRQQQMLSEA